MRVYTNTCTQTQKYAFIGVKSTNTHYLSHEKPLNPHPCPHTSTNSNLRCLTFDHTLRKFRFDAVLAVSDGYF